MFKKIKLWWNNRQELNKKLSNLTHKEEKYSRDVVENAYKLGYTDGRRDGLSIARAQATRSLREILKTQNQSK